VIVILRDLGHKWLKEKIDPLARLVRKPGATNTSNATMINAQKCKERAEMILRKFAGPEVIDHYTNLLEKAEAVLKTEKEKQNEPDAPTDPAPAETAVTAPTPAAASTPETNENSNTAENGNPEPNEDAMQVESPTPPTPQDASTTPEGSIQIGNTESAAGAK